MSSDIIFLVTYVGENSKICGRFLTCEELFPETPLTEIEYYKTHSIPYYERRSLHGLHIVLDGDPELGNFKRLLFVGLINIQDGTSVGDRILAGNYDVVYHFNRYLDIVIELEMQNVAEVNYLH